jgi:hypothetical protein
VPTHPRDTGGHNIADNPGTRDSPLQHMIVAIPGCFHESPCLIEVGCRIALMRIRQIAVDRWL